jgi:hypothetical protein
MSSATGFAEEWQCVGGTDQECTRWVGEEDLFDDNGSVTPLCKKHQEEEDKA